MNFNMTTPYNGDEIKSDKDFQIVFIKVTNFSMTKIHKVSLTLIDVPFISVYRYHVKSICLSVYLFIYLNTSYVANFEPTVF
jgi:hypothetical protein